MSTRHIRCAGFGAAVDACVTDRNELWFVSMLGNQQSLRALWARLLKGEPAVISEDVSTGGQLYTLASETPIVWLYATHGCPGSVGQFIFHVTQPSSTSP